ncbi:MupA/Atu3671 family FMN-dependent luciferase-like monooxygenase [Streptomyces platensis]|uniref:MupA/Atu3671 family FMN-dependent luciferase-like monooxygenase n=1 Tax=Streptomyces platensis TaxID=58346 RepID=UPI002E261AA0|nr:MupA/Atu3671 family FMN-dependent luciferase-like monooxygenase [Streptomyces platensis]WUB77745.1 LLM class flavin-dependent oxidoreductase [Streptomyces platensis]WUB84576.1 LLM class flavin-dependent oxidoreductase [Streptomyces platensis]
MKFGLFYFANDSTEDADGGRYKILLDGARFADENGFSAIWTPERHFHPFGGLYPNPAVVGAALAAATEHISIRAGSVVAPLHSPLRIAEEWSVVDNLSHGRAEVSFASGWHPVDFCLSQGSSYMSRKETMLETIDTVRTLWRGDPVDVVDGTDNPASVRMFPPPVQKELPTWITSAGETETFRMAGAARAGVLTHLLHQDVDELAEKIAAYRAAARAAHEDWDGRVAVMLHTFLGDDRDHVREVVHDPLCDYLKSSFHLIVRSIADVGPDFDVDSLHDDDVDFLVERSFSTYFDERGLFGTVDQAAEMVERLRGIGVDEIACLIDFGIDGKVALDGLRQLDQLRRRFQ